MTRYLICFAGPGLEIFIVPRSVLDKDGALSCGNLDFSGFPFSLNFFLFFFVKFVEVKEHFLKGFGGGPGLGLTGLVERVIVYNATRGGGGG